MHRARSGLIGAAVAGLLLAWAAGCATPPGGGPRPAPVPAAAVPPAHLWVPGGWEWQGARWVWHDGHWTKPGQGPGPLPPQR